MDGSLALQNGMHVVSCSSHSAAGSGAAVTQPVHHQAAASLAAVSPAALTVPKEVAVGGGPVRPTCTMTASTMQIQLVQATPPKPAAQSTLM